MQTVLTSVLMSGSAGWIPMVVVVLIGADSADFTMARITCQADYKK